MSAKSGNEILHNFDFDQNFAKSRNAILHNFAFGQNFAKSKILHNFDQDHCQVSACPVCREVYPEKGQRRHRFAEKADDIIVYSNNFFIQTIVGKKTQVCGKVSRHFER